ncbi:MAG: NAD(P)/FAD-dependent oxidoreductase [Ginsengibacter sp.]
MEKFDVIVVGAGAAGLLAAKILSSAKLNVCLIEGRDRIGGRAHTIAKKGFSKPVETGAEFIHGKLPVTTHLLDEAGIKYYETKGALWEVKDKSLVKKMGFIDHADQLENKLNKLEEDIPVADFITKYFDGPEYVYTKHSLQQYIEGYDAGNIHDFSSLALKEEWENDDGKQFRIEGGYGKLLEHLLQKCTENGCTLHLSTIAKKINWQTGRAEVITAGQGCYFAAKVIITVPPSLLVNDHQLAGITFSPPLPGITEAAMKIGYGGVVKIVVEFSHAFWETGEVRKAEKLYFLFSEEKIPVWWSQLPDTTPMLCGWLAGPRANEMHATNQEILEIAIGSLTSIFGMSSSSIQKIITGSYVHNWVTDPFSRGGYSYNSMTTEVGKKTLRTPIAGTLYFAGEALAEKTNATVESAFESAVEVTAKILTGYIPAV